MESMKNLLGLKASKKRIIVSLGIIIMVVTSLYPTSGVIMDEKSPPIVILFDFGHNQFFNETYYSKAIEALKEMKINDTQSIEIRITHGTLNETILAGVDVLIITNPGENASYSDAEYFAISEWFKNYGKGMFLLSNPYSENNSIIGRPQILNNILLNDYLSITGIEFLSVSSADEKPDVVVCDTCGLDPKGYIIRTAIPKGNNSHEILTNVSVITTYSQSLQSTSPVLSLNKSMYVYYPDGSTQLLEESPIILAAKEVGDFKVLLSGSTIMFSDLPVRNLGTSWFEADNNSLLWKNSIKWLLSDTNLGISEPPVERIFKLNDLTIVGGLAGFSVFFILLGFIYRFIGPNPSTEITPDKALEQLKRKIKEKEAEKEKKEVTPKGEKPIKRRKKKRRVK